MKRHRIDGCTASPELWYHDCCNRHDLDYLTGTDAAGQALTRAAADIRFFHCMRKAGKNLPIRGLILPFVYFAAVRLFGGFYWPKSRT